MIGRRGERGSGISVLAARHDDDDELFITTNVVAVKSTGIGGIRSWSKTNWSFLLRCALD